MDSNAIMLKWEINQRNKDQIFDIIYIYEICFKYKQIKTDRNRVKNGFQGLEHRETEKVSKMVLTFRVPFKVENP